MKLLRAVLFVVLVILLSPLLLMQILIQPLDRGTSAHPGDFS